MAQLYNSISPYNSQRLFSFPFKNLIMKKFLNGTLKLIKNKQDQDSCMYFPRIRLRIKRS